MKIVLYLPNANLWGDITPGRAAMVGGTERCIQRIAGELAKHGAEAHVLTTHEGSPTTVNGVTYHALAETDAIAADASIDVFVDAAVTDILGVVKAKKKVAFIPFNHKDWRKLDRKIDCYVVNSPIKKEFVLRQNPFIDPDKISLIGPGVDLIDYDACKAKTVPYRLLWSSSPDRGLYHLLRFWPQIRADFPDATLHVTYNTRAMESYRWLHDAHAEWARAIEEGEDLPGVTYCGGLRRDLFIREQKEAALMALPHELLAPGETYSMLPLEMLAAQVPLLMTDDLPIVEMYGTYGHVIPLPIRDEIWVAAIKDLLTNKEERMKYVAAGRAFAESRTWEKVGEEWTTLLTA